MRTQAILLPLLGAINATPTYKLDNGDCREIDGNGLVDPSNHDLCCADADPDAGGDESLVVFC